MITSVRAPIPVAEVPRPAVGVGLPVQDRVQATTSPVSRTELAAAVQQVTASVRPKPAESLLPQIDPETRAAEAAEAARRAYIKASIAAGVSPLPLP